MSEINLLFRKNGHPHEDEFVLCEVESISRNSVFVSLIEYEGYRGIIPIYEIAPGRIRNIRKYVKEGKVIVCKVLNVDPLRKHVTVSLRRVSERETKNKISWLKQEQDAEKVLEVVSQRTGYDLKELFVSLTRALPKNYENLFDFFQDISAGDAKIKTDLPKDIEQEVVKTIKERIKPKEVIMSADFTVTSTLPDGLEVIRSLFTTLKSKYSKENAHFQYSGGGKYTVRITTKDVKHADSILKNIFSDIETIVGNKASFAFLSKTVKK
ncbi:MAG: translation initiation factor 2 subunit 1 [Candidatus Woesearchaeota archaeon]|nr:translation initiation factor 2 subunit 1 [Candidatus Woesearchaeota archaeon]MDN5327954.1 translation initiation factor 2 subunit 1 [Candidatus Woesearchaeota archaeon]